MTPGDEIELRRLPAHDPCRRADELRSEVISAYCHDIRQPLSAALLRTTALLDEISDRSQRALAIELHQNLQEIALTSEAVFDAIQLSRSAIRPRIADVDIGRVIRQLAITHDAPARAKGLRLCCRSTGVIATTDEWLLTRILQNLLSNAIRYTVTGAVLLTCRKSKGQLRFEVRDSGPGLDRSVVQDLMDERQGNPAEGRQPRSGLGLGNCREFAYLLGATLSLYTGPQMGTRFRLVLPGPIELLSKTKEASTSATRPLSVATLLEDGQAAFEVAKRFTVAGWRCTHFTDPMQFLAAVVAPGLRPSGVVIPARVGSVTAEFLLRIMLSRFDDLKAVVVFPESGVVDMDLPFERNIRSVVGLVSSEDIEWLEKQVCPRWMPKHARGHADLQRNDDGLSASNKREHRDV